MAALFVLSAPYWGLALLSMIRAAGRPRARKGWFANRYSAFGIAAVGLGAGTVAASLGLFALLGCDGGMIDPIVCRRAPDGLGRALDNFAFLYQILTAAVGVPSLVLCAVAEAVTRVRLSRRG